MPAFPGVVYDVDMGSFQIVYSRPPLATEMENGYVRKRPRPGGRVATITQNLIMSNENWVNAIVPFVKNDLQDGSLLFTQTVWNGVAWETGRTVQLIDPPTSRHHSPYETIASWNLRVFDFA